MVTTSPRFAVPPPVAPLCMLLAAGTGVATAARPLGSYMDLWERIAEAAASLRPIPDSMPATARGHCATISSKAPCVLEASQGLAEDRHQEM